MIIDRIFYGIGISTCIVFVFLILILFFDKLYWNIKLCRLKHKQKHRFDKPPMAACYCRDCNKWDFDTGECSVFTRRKTKDDWFCKDAVRNVSLAEEEKRDFRDRSNKLLQDRKLKRKSAR